MSDVLGGTARSATEIARELSREFESALYQRTGVQPEPDPILATVFHALAVQVARVYEEAEVAFPANVLDDLINVLGIEPRLARPAQTIVQFSGVEERERIGPEVELRGYNKSGEQIGFSPDESVELSPAELRFSGIYERGRLHAIRGGRTSTDGPPIPAGSVPLSLGNRPPTLFLAIDADASHLSGLGVFLETGAQGTSLSESIQQSPWQLLHDGATEPTGVLRSWPARGGVRRLAWLDGEVGKTDDSVLSSARGGVYGGQVFVFPPVASDRRFTSGVPTAIADAVKRLLPPENPGALDKPLVWLQIPLPADSEGVSTTLSKVALNCVSASNVEAFNERIVFDQMGTVVTLEPEGRRNRHLMGVLSVTGEGGAAYVEESDVSAPVGRGRYRHRAGRLELRAGNVSAARLDKYAMVRLLYCDGEAANGLEPGDLKQIASSLRNVTAQVSNLTAARGGAPPPAYTEARLRFADQIRNRERIVTAADVESATRSFEPRIHTVTVDSGPEITPKGVRRVERVRARVSAAEFADPEASIPRLRAELQAHLQSRAVLGAHFGVEVDVV